MAKKPTNWVTIPEASLHTPVSEGVREKKTSPDDGTEPVKNKFLWGIGFVVLVIAAFAALAPGQFADLLKGNIFAPGSQEDSSNPIFNAKGVSGTDTASPINPINLLPGKTEEKPAADTTGEEVAKTDETQKPAEPVVKPQDEAVDVAVQPISQPEEVSVAPIAKEPEACRDVSCLLTHLTDCSLAKGHFGYAMLGQVIEADLEITGIEGVNCLTKVSLTKAPESVMIGKEAACKLPKGAYTEDSLRAVFSDMQSVTAKCAGSAIDALKEYTVGLSAADAQAKLIEELKKQVDQLQGQKDQSLEALQDLTKIVQDQAARPAAPSPDQGAATGIPPSVATTTALGQIPTQQPGFRQNPYRATVTPEEMLRRNTAAGAQGAYGYEQAPANQGYQSATGISQGYQVSAAKAKKTPESGPSENVLIAFVATFFSLVVWKFMRLMVRE